MSDESRTDTIGFIGLGNMGGAIVRRMLACNVSVIGFDINQLTMARFEALGMSPASSARDVADRATLVIVCIPTGGNPEVTREVVQGSAIEIYAEFSTMKPARMREIEAIVDAAGVALVDAPVSGGVAIAERGELSVMMAGSRDAMARLAKAMATVASRTLEIGETPGQAQFCKLVNNAIGFTVFMASCEALAVGASGGIDPAVLLDAVNAGSGNNSWTTDKFGPHILSRTFDAGGKMPGGPKALDLYLDEAAAVGMPPGMVAMARNYWAKIAEGFGAEEDFTNMIKYFEKHVGAELRSPVYEKS
ncbi:MAG: NAD(P)-dependent oxidoreductase [Gammaproteobacteria bacterium]|nr:NAD(P)-dependent oxidoreductase [Gammaproteobacteria bacterium]